ncbi:DUF3306 domain-containing protein [Azospirillum rugosum]|uniref:DUF3306 domain-containing protein n=1 Tax=Azospirillum rugosum TaxID=416170 RepID=A0ABS4SNE5_9PROT|nr:DUF3306 domain-containing protein [Azospirillum rugosum]MBP2294074.1 hypothetical protein [Azospirillum rugosum]MDQ0527537.1 hypothetical protein [Azospirillum rugosum]
MTDEPFLSRWSRLKRQSAEPVPEPVAEELPAQLPEPVPEENAEATAEAADADDPLKDLPPVEELTRESDYTPFLRAEVPEDLHRQALRKLWASDPVFANDDGLKDYADDYASLFTGNSPVKTLYRVGKGFLDAAEGAAEEAAERAEMDKAATAGAEDPAAAPQVKDEQPTVGGAADYGGDVSKSS